MPDGPACHQQGNLRFEILEVADKVVLKVRVWAFRGSEVKDTNADG